MGIDWVRMRPKPGVSIEKLNQLIAEQAEGFQGLDDERLNQQYCRASRELWELLDFPAWDEATGLALDDPHLAIRMRNYPIARN